MNLATYGSLMIPEVMHELLQKGFSSELVTLTGFERFLLNGKRYPGLIKSDQSVLDCRVYFDLDPVSIQILDKFEDDIYERVTLPIETSRGHVDARAYIVPDSSRALLSSSPWIEEEFRRVHLADYLEMCGRFRNKILPLLAG